MSTDMPNHRFFANQMQGRQGLTVMRMVSHRRCHQNGGIKIWPHIPEASLILSSRIASTTLSPSKPRGTLPKLTQKPFSLTKEDPFLNSLRVNPFDRPLK